MRSPAAIAKTAQRRRDKRFKQRNKATIAPRATEQGLRGAPATAAGEPAGRNAAAGRAARPVAPAPVAAPRAAR